MKQKLEIHLGAGCGARKINTFPYLLTPPLPKVTCKLDRSYDPENSEGINAAYEEEKEKLEENVTVTHPHLYHREEMSHEIRSLTSEARSEIRKTGKS